MGNKPGGEEGASGVEPRALGSGNAPRKVKGPKDKYQPRNKTLRLKPKVSKLYEYQQTLPTLPIPEFDVTMDRFLETVRPFLNDHDYAETKKTVDEYKASIDSFELHAALKKYAETQTSYIEKFWVNTYLDQEKPIAINSNPCFVLEDDPSRGATDQISRATTICLSIFKIVRQIRIESMEPDMDKKTPLSMDQYETIFGSARLPFKGRDKVITDQKSTHLVVFYRAQAYFFDCITEAGELVITETQFADNLRVIQQNADDVSDEDVASQAVGVFTSANRSTWAEYRNKLCKLSPTNQESLDVIDSALFVLCLDEFETDSITDAYRNTLHGTTNLDDEVGEYETGSCISRWFDKLQVIVSANATVGVVWEHSKWDGHSMLRIFSDVMTDAVIRFAQQISGKQRVKAHVESKRIDPEMLNNIHILPRKLKFELNADIEQKIGEVTRSVSKTISSLMGLILSYDQFGKNLLKANGYSPDAFAQMAMLCTFYNVKGYLPNQYESVMTKAFKNGRSEAGRAASIPALTWCRAFSDEEMESGDKLKLLKDACRTHSMMTRRCGMGQGVDRYLYALKSVWEDEHQGDQSEELPSIFKSPGYEKLCVSQMSTSNCGNSAMRAFGFGPVCDEGIGIGYMIQENEMTFSITSFTVSAQKFREELLEYLNQVYYWLYDKHEDNLEKARSETKASSNSRAKPMVGETLR